MRSHIGLYYPFIHFKDDAWIKLTALYWDKMARIVPRGYRTSDSDTVKQLANESDFIEDVNMGFLSHDLKLDATFIQLLHQYQAQLQDKYGIAQRHTWVDNPQTKVAAPPGKDPKLAYIYIEKMSPDVIQAFVDTGLAETDWHVDEHGHSIEVGRVGMHPKLAFIYMTVLAEEIAASWKYHPVTDETLDHLAVTGCTLERLTQALLGNAVPISGPELTEHEMEVQMATIAIQSVLPQRIADVPIEKIVAFRGRDAAERAAFQDYLHKSVADFGTLKEIKDQDAVRTHLESIHDKYLKPQLNEYKRRLKALGIDTVMGALNVRVALPPLVTSSAEMAGLSTINPLLVFGGAIAFSLLPVIRDKRKEARDLKGEFPLPAYLMNVEEGLRTPTLMQWVAERARHFFFRV